MISRPLGTMVSVALLILMPAACGRARAQIFGAGFPSAGSYGSGYGANLSAGYGSYGGAIATGYGYGVRNGQVGAGYRSASMLYNQGYRAARPQTTTSFGPLYSAITSLPGWYGPAPRARRRYPATRPAAPRVSPLDADGKIRWPSTIPDDPAARESRRAAEASVLSVAREYKSTGHGSIRPVIDAKEKLSAFERKVMPEVKAKNITDGDALDTFFFDLDNALDTMTYTY
jgi:hypothetical protein